MKPRARMLIAVLAPAAVIILSGCLGPRREEARSDRVDTLDVLASPASSNPMEATNTVRDVRSAIAAALAHNPEIGLLRQEMDVKRAEAVTASGLRNPELRVGYDNGARHVERTWYTNIAENLAAPFTNTTWSPLAMHGDDLQDQDSLRLALRVFPPNPWLLWAQGDGARARFAAATADLRAAEWRVECGVRKLFNELDYLGRDLELAGGLAEVRRAEAEMMRELADKQQVTAVDELGAVQRHYQALMDREKIETSLMARRADLNALVGASVQGVPSGPQDAGDVSGTIPDERLAAMREKAVENRQEVVAAYWRQQSAQAALREARSLRVPWFSYIQGSYVKGRAHESLTGVASFDTVPGGTPDPIIATDETDDEDWGIEAAVEIPVFSLGPGATRIQRADCQRWATLFGETTRRVLTQLDEAVTVWRGTSKRAERLETDSAALLKRAEGLAGAIAERSDLAPGDAGKVQEAILQMKRTVLESNLEKRQAWLRLEEAFGASLKAIETRPEIR